MMLEYIWPGLWIVSLVPLLGFVTTLDGLSSSSVQLGHQLRIRAEWLLIAALLTILISLVLFFDLRFSDLSFDIYGSLDRHSDRDPRVWRDREFLEVRLFLMDVLVVLFSLPVVTWMAVKRRRPLHLWLLLGLLGTYGAIIWLAVNGQTTERAAVDKAA
jgi:hypothetical protein